MGCSHSVFTSVTYYGEPTHLLSIVPILWIASASASSGPGHANGIQGSGSAIYLTGGAQAAFKFHLDRPIQGFLKHQYLTDIDFNSVYWRHIWPRDNLERFMAFSLLPVLLQ
jgi:hypothetical protein